MVGSSGANLYAAIAGGILALWGPLHGGANQAVIEMLEEIKASGGDYKKFIDDVKNKRDNRRLMGFGHRVYKNYDPRAKILKKMCDEVLAHLGVKDPLLDIAKAMEEVALKDDYFISKKLYPNVDFYCGIIYRALGIPTNMFTVMFALGRLPGWIAHWKEMVEDPQTKIGRPRQIYTGEKLRKFVPIDRARATAARFGARRELLLAARRQHLRSVLAFPVAGRIVIAHVDVVALALHVAAADLARAPPHDLREVAGLHREATVGELVELDLVVPHGDGALGIERADGARGEVLAVLLAAAVAEHAALRLAACSAQLCATSASFGDQVSGGAQCFARASLCASTNCCATESLGAGFGASGSARRRLGCRRRLAATGRRRDGLGAATALRRPGCCVHRPARREHKQTRRRMARS